MDENTNDRTVLAAVKEVFDRAGVAPPVPREEISIDDAYAVLEAEIERLETTLDE